MKLTICKVYKIAIVFIIDPETLHEMIKLLDNLINKSKKDGRTNIIFE